MQATNTDAETELVVAGLLDFVQKEIIPLEESVHDTLHDPRMQYDQDGRECDVLTAVRRQARMASGRAGFYTMFCPVSLGGGGLGALTYYRSWEELHHVFGPGERLTHNVIAHWTSGPSAVWDGISDRLKADVLPGVMSGELQGCFGMSEPDAGSDAWRMKTTATRDGDGWTVSGSKQWTSFSPTADFILAFCVTNKAQAEARRGGITCFYIPTASPGFAVDSVIRMFGELGGREGILSLTDIAVPDDNRIGEEGRGFDLAMRGATLGRLYNSARSVGLSRWALERAVEYSQTRRTMGKAIAEHQSIQNMLADSAVEIYAARSMGLDCARRIDEGNETRRDVAMAKLFATNAANRIFDRAMQVFGAMGITNEVRLYEGWKTVRSIRIADGTDEILRRTISRELLKGYVSFG